MRESGRCDTRYSRASHTLSLSKIHTHSHVCAHTLSPLSNTHTNPLTHILHTCIQQLSPKTVIFSGHSHTCKCTNDRRKIIKHKHIHFYSHKRFTSNTPLLLDTQARTDTDLNMDMHLLAKPQKNHKHTYIHTHILNESRVHTHKHTHTHIYSDNTHTQTH